MWFQAVYVTQLLVAANLPWSAIAIIYAYTLTGSAIVRFASPDLAGFAARTSQIEGVFRRTHQRLIANGESIAMMGGEEQELNVLNMQSNVIETEKQRQITQQVRFDAGQSWFNTYLPVMITNALRMSWSSSQYGSAEQVMAESGGTGMSAAGLYLENLILESFAAVTGILSIHSTLATLVGHTRRVTDLLLVIDDVKAKRVQQQLAVERNTGGHTISFCAVDVVAPDGQCIAQNITFQVTADGSSNLAITGGNAVGKSSLFRVLGGLWSQQRGCIELPPHAHDHASSADPFATTLALVPQQPLVPTVPISLADMITYPTVVRPFERSESQVSTSTQFGCLLLFIACACESQV